MNQRNSTETVWIETTMHRCTELDAYIPPQTLRQGRDAKNSVPRISMLSGIPRTEEDDQFRGAVWRVLSVALVAGWAAVAWVFTR